MPPKKAEKAKPAAKRGRDTDAADNAKAAPAKAAKRELRSSKPASKPALAKGGKAERTSTPAAPSLVTAPSPAAATLPSVAQLAAQCLAHVSHFSFDDPSGPAPAVSFTQRYAMDFGVSSTEAASHVAEYLRFMALKAALLLAAEGGALASSATALGVTPPLAVDCVWHTHLLYSRSYVRLCGALLGATSAPAAAATAPLTHFIHHEPSRGGVAQMQLFTAQYAAAKTLYRDAFGAPPPQQVWTPAEHRFEGLNQMVCLPLVDRIRGRTLMMVTDHPDGPSDEDEDPDEDHGYDSMGCG